MAKVYCIVLVKWRRSEDFAKHEDLMVNFLCMLRVKNGSRLNIHYFAHSHLLNLWTYCF